MNVFLLRVTMILLALGGVARAAEASVDELWAKIYDRPQRLSALDHPAVVYLDIEYVDVIHKTWKSLSDPRKESHQTKMRERLKTLSGLDSLVFHRSEVSGADLDNPRVKAILIGGRVTTDVPPRDEPFYNLIRHAKIPIIGFCGGCQLIGKAYGETIVPMRRLKPGEADPCPEYHPGAFKEMGFCKVFVRQADPLFADLGDELVVKQSHAFQLSDVPAGFDLLASSPDCRVQAIRHRDRLLYGVQFHPEQYDASHPDGGTLLRNFFRLALGKHGASEPNLIQRENSREGATDWQLTRVRINQEDGCRSEEIEGYCSKQSVAAGEKLQIMVSTDPASRFKLEIFRMGYYGGRGARLMKTLGPLEGKPQPVPKPDARTMHECRWDPSVELTIPADWPSGVYLGRLTTLPDSDDKPYWQSYVIFIVRDDRPADVLFQCSDNTWQAYNGWPYKSSLYTHPKDTLGPWADVSVDRPYGREAQHEGIVNDPLSVGSGGFLTFEFPLAYWLEQQGYDVTYCSNSDLLTPNRGLKCKAFLSVGHDEYWDIRQYHSAVKLRDEGVNLMFLCANAVCWISPLKPNADGRPNRVICRAGSYSESNEWGQSRLKKHGPFTERGPDEGYLIGARNAIPVNGGGDWVCIKPEHWIFEGTGMKLGDRIPGLVGWEFYGDPPTDLPGLEVVGRGIAFQYGVNPTTWTATIYPGPKGNFVFNASTIFWPQGLSSPPGHMLPWSHWNHPHGPDARVQQITRNLLRRAGCALP